ncbi:MAG: V-type ATP synthase subunit D [Candidatus Hydrogenedentes bacterium]|nr:V-type ATP synthase subunit D [Candidatus Hydrogenedentota bacterium]
MSLDTFSPTRMNLLQRKAQIKLAVDGVVLLKGKRDALLQELLKRARELRSMRNELHHRGRGAAVALALARAVCGTPELRSAALAGRREITLSVHTEKVWGVGLGDITVDGVVRDLKSRGIGMLDNSAHVHEVAQAYEEMLEQLLKCAPMERNLQAIGQEVKKVSRRINALEEYLIPKLSGEMNAISRVLNEREREDTFRMKRIKGKKGRQRLASETAESGGADHASG